MVKTEEIKDEAVMFNAVWSFYKATLPVHDNRDDDYWNDVVTKADQLCNEYPTELCREFVCTILAELERKAKGK